MNNQSIFIQARSNYESTSALEALFEDTERILLELKILIESCMCAIPKRELGRGKRRPRNAIEVSDLIGTALCIESGMWRRKDLDDIDYECPLEMEQLFPDKSAVQVINVYYNMPMSFVAVILTSFFLYAVLGED